MEGGLACRIFNKIHYLWILRTNTSETGFAPLAPLLAPSVCWLKVKRSGNSLGPPKVVSEGVKCAEWKCEAYPKGVFDLGVALLRILAFPIPLVEQLASIVYFKTSDNRSPSTVYYRLTVVLDRFALPIAPHLLAPN